MNWRGAICDCRGAAAAEMALILPGIAFVLLNVVDLSMYVWTRMQVDHAAHEAVGAVRMECDDSDATHALPATVGSNCTTYSSAMTTAAQQATSLGNTVTISNTTEAYYCADSTGALVQVAAASGTPPADCDGTLSGSTSEPGIYISTRVSKSFNPVFPGASVASLLPNTIHRTAWMRLQ